MPRHVAIALLLVPLALWVGAAEAADAPKPAPPAAPLPFAGMSPDAAAQIPDAKKQELADDSLRTIRKIVDRVAGRAEDARVDRDVSRLNCLNAQLTQMKGLQKVATQARQALVDAIGKRDPATANTQFARVAIASDKVQRMGSEADVCLGQLAYLVDGQTTVQMEQPPGLPGQDVTIREPPPPVSVTPPVVRPPPASTFQP